MESVTVRVANREYEVQVGLGAIDALGPFLQERFPRSRLFSICDENTYELFQRRLEDACRRAPAWLINPPGESQKNLGTAERLYTDLLERGATRGDLIIALGGGVVGDIAGFVAATYFRGIEFIQIPTTLLAMVDSSIGGKVGVDLPGAKNAVGAFWQPVAVFADTSTLSSLPDEEYLAGMAEVAKYALVFDEGMVDLLEKEADRLAHRDGLLLEQVIVRCAGLKSRVVEEDERDRGSRLLLNYGHTFAHGIEAAAGYTGITHGQAVARGMLMAARFSELVGVGEPGLLATHVALEEALGLATATSPSPATQDILRAMRSDKKREGSLRLILLKTTGQPVILAGPEEEDLARAVEDIRQGGELS